MSPAATELLNAILALPDEDRAEVAAELEPFAEHPPLELDPEFEAELDRRVARMESGESKPIPVAEAMAIVRADLESMRSRRA